MKFLAKLIKALFLNAVVALGIWILVSLFITFADSNVTHGELLPVYPFIYFILLSLALARFEKKHLS